MSVNPDARCANPACGVVLAEIAGTGARGRCRACYVYQWRTGRERPASVTTRCHCGRRAVGRGLCHRHYQQWRRRYSPRARAYAAAQQARRWLRQEGIV